MKTESGARVVELTENRKEAQGEEELLEMK